jgi:DNA recombination protein RmuC
MNTLTIVLLIINAITLVFVYLLFSKKSEAIADTRIDLILSNQNRLEGSLKQDFQAQATIITNNEKEIRAQVEQKINQQIESIKNEFRDFNIHLKTRFEELTKYQKDRYEEIEKRQNELIASTDKHLNELRTTVEEKLQKTLNERITQSFLLVGQQLDLVQKGLGDMQTLAQDVGGLKKVLSNVKMRGGFGEVQLSLLLEQILAPDQYEANVKTKKGSNDLVEFAVKLPGKDEEGSVVYLPMDAKFPKDVYQTLQEAYEVGDPDKFAAAQKNLEITIKKMAKDIRDKYIDPPNTTDFGIMFLPFEGIYAEVVKKASLLEEIQRDYKIIITGPTTLAAILNSLQMGFRTLAIQKSSSEVWKVLGAVKKEFEIFGGLIGKAQNNIQTGLNQLDEVLGVRTRAINSKLKNINVIESAGATALLPDIETTVED